jgi:nucleoside-diphosphate-sugar epimerase
MRVLVTGATGFIGRALVPSLCAESDIDVSVLLRDKSTASDAQPESTAYYEGITAVKADLRDLDGTAGAIAEAAPDAVIHLAAAGATDPFLDVEHAVSHNLTGTINLLRACFEGTDSCQQFLMARSPGETTAMNVYAASKAAVWKFCEMYVRTRQWPVRAAMIFQAYGPGQPNRALVPSAMRAALSGRDFPMTLGEQERDWTYIGDVVEGIMATVEADLEPGSTIEIGTGRKTSVAEVVQQIYRLVGRGGAPALGELKSRPGEARVQVADAHLTQALTGWKAGIDLGTGLSMCAARLGALVG